MFIVTKKIDSENISKVCRTCLREDNDKMVYLFVGPADSSLAAKLQSLSCLKVTQGDGLPEKMCDRCVIRAESALLFREQCRAADRALKQAAVAAANVPNIPAYPTMPPSQMYNQHGNQNLEPLPTPSKLPNCSSFPNHQELYMHNQLYPTFYQQEENVYQHSHIMKSHNSYYNLNYPGADNQVFIDKSSFTRPNNHLYYKTTCALQCSICNYTFSDKTQLVNHSLIHNEDQGDQTSNDEINVEIEDNSNTAEKNNYGKSASHLIESSFDTATYNKIHFNCDNRVKNPSFENIIDKSNTKDGISAINSINTYHDDVEYYKNTSDPDKSNRYHCDICDSYFNKKSRLVAHQLTHNKNKTFKCAQCGKSYSSKSKLAAHSRLHTQTNVHRCTICQKIFAYPSYLKEHMKSHCSQPVKKASYECAQCRKQFYLSKSYERHMKFHTGKDLYHCDICNKLFSQKYSLKVHMRSHEKTRFHKCDICDKAFNQKSNLVEHIRTHTKVKPFKCKICDKSFVQSSHLKIHELTHNSIRRFQCRMCGKRFKLPSHLKRHTDLHTGLKLYKCEQCNQMFSQAFSLKRHAKKHAESANA